MSKQNHINLGCYTSHQLRYFPMAPHLEMEAQIKAHKLSVNSAIKILWFYTLLVCPFKLDSMILRKLIQASLVWGRIFVFPNINKQDGSKLQSSQVLIQAFMTLGYRYSWTLSFSPTLPFIPSFYRKHCNDPLQTWTMKVHILQMTPQPICPIYMRDGKWLHSSGIQNKTHMRQLPSWQGNPVIRKVICFLHLQTQRLHLFPLP